MAIIVIKRRDEVAGLPRPPEGGWWLFRYHRERCGRDIQRSGSWPSGKASGLGVMVMSGRLGPANP